MPGPSTFSHQRRSLLLDPPVWPLSSHFTDEAMLCRETRGRGPGLRAASLDGALTLCKAASCSLRPTGDETEQGGPGTSLELELAWTPAGEARVRPGVTSETPAARWMSRASSRGGHRARGSWTCLLMKQGAEQWWEQLKERRTGFWQEGVLWAQLLPSPAEFTC